MSELALQVQVVFSPPLQTQQHFQGSVLPGWQTCKSVSFYVNKVMLFGHAAHLCTSKSGKTWFPMTSSPRAHSGEAAWHRCLWYCWWRPFCCSESHLEHHPLFPGRFSFPLSSITLTCQGIISVHAQLIVFVTDLTNTPAVLPWSR